MISFEFFPSADNSQWPAFFSTAKELASLNPLFVSVTYGAGGAKQQNTLAITKELASMGLTTMAHLTCVGAEPENLKKFLSELIKPITIGNIKIDMPLLLAPMAGVTNQPFRIICKEVGNVRTCMYRNGKFKSYFS